MNQKCEIQLINLNHNEYSQELHHPFAVKLDRCVGSCITLNELYNEVCGPNKTEDLNVHVFSKVTGLNESKTFAKDTPCKCKCKFDGRKYNSNQK